MVPQNRVLPTLSGYLTFSLYYLCISFIIVNLKKSNAIYKYSNYRASSILNICGNISMETIFKMTLCCLNAQKIFLNPVLRLFKAAFQRQFCDLFKFLPFTFYTAKKSSENYIGNRYSIFRMGE